MLDPDDAIHIGDEDPLNNTVSITATVNIPTGRRARRRRRGRRPRETNCCVIHVVSGTATHATSPHWPYMMETAVQQVAGRLGVQPSRKLEVYLIDRVVGRAGLPAPTSSYPTPTGAMPAAASDNCSSTRPPTSSISLIRPTAHLVHGRRTGRVG